jgi:hypothetical protein
MSKNTKPNTTKKFWRTRPEALFAACSGQIQPKNVNFREQLSFVGSTQKVLNWIDQFYLSEELRATRWRGGRGLAQCITLPTSNQDLWLRAPQVPTFYTTVTTDISRHRNKQKTARSVDKNFVFTALFDIVWTFFPISFNWCDLKVHFIRHNKPTSKPRENPQWQQIHTTFSGFHLGFHFCFHTHLPHDICCNRKNELLGRTNWRR